MYQLKLRLTDFCSLVRAEKATTDWVKKGSWKCSVLTQLPVVRTSLRGFQLSCHLKSTYQGISLAKLQLSWTVQHTLRCIFPLSKQTSSSIPSYFFRTWLFCKEHGWLSTQPTSRLSRAKKLSYDVPFPLTQTCCHPLRFTGSLVKKDWTDNKMER